VYLKFKISKGGLVGYVAGIYSAQHYNIPPVESWLFKTKRKVEQIEK